MELGGGLEELPKIELVDDGAANWQVSYSEMLPGDVAKKSSPSKASP